MNRKTLIVLCIALMSGGQALEAQEAKKPWWNLFPAAEADDTGPVRSSSIFGGSSELETNEPAGTEEKSSWLKMPSMPKLWSRSPESANKPSPLKRMTAGTKRFWTGTVDFLNPFDSPEEVKTNGYMPQHSLRTDRKEESGWFDWMFTEEIDDSPATVNDFLNQSRPRW